MKQRGGEWRRVVAQQWVRHLAPTRQTRVAGPPLGQRRRRWANIRPAVVRRPVFILGTHLNNSPICSTFSACWEAYLGSDVPMRGPFWGLTDTPAADAGPSLPQCSGNVCKVSPALRQIWVTINVSWTDHSLLLCVWYIVHNKTQVHKYVTRLIYYVLVGLSPTESKVNITITAN